MTSRELIIETGTFGARFLILLFGMFTSVN